MSPVDSDFETLKQLVRSQFGTEVGFGITSKTIGEQLGAAEGAVLRALSACEQGGDAWILFQEGGERYWSGEAVPCEESLPACYAPGGEESSWTGADTGGFVFDEPAAEPPSKKLRTGIASAQIPAASFLPRSSGDPFEELKCLLHGIVAEAGQRGVTSGKIGFDLGADRKAITAALYACEKDGKVQNMSPGGAPRWLSIQTPPPNAHLTPLPEKYGYKGAKEGRQQHATEKRQQHQFAATVAAPVMGMAPAASSAGTNSDASNPVGLLNEWSQKNKRKVDFQDMGNIAGGFGCKVTVDGRQVALEKAKNKKQAKINAALAAARALGLV
eukprot:TRINITY_DN49027_c0_g1_i1.p1 TRINITY_DN49027_c0_g1~~TRINITY_DN49027_c0_g1_i1.p1  ORF type:complete len:336 (-),score=88.27 TRINITY_DN49027_c0_g1_i1:56-1042(-)